MLHIHILRKIYLGTILQLELQTHTRVRKLLQNAERIRVSQWRRSSFVRVAWCEPTLVEDNGLEGEKDRLAWGIYQNPPTGWTPKDAELDDDEGAKLRWLATDAEWKDDVGVPSDLSKVVRCTTFPVGSYDFPEFKYGGGDLQVTSR